MDYVFLPTPSSRNEFLKIRSWPLLFFFFSLPSSSRICLLLKYFYAIFLELLSTSEADSFYELTSMLIIYHFLSVNHWLMAFFNFSPIKIIHSSKLMSKVKERFLRTLMVDDDIIGVCKLERKINGCCKMIFLGHWNESTSKWSFDMKFIDYSIIISPYWICKLYWFMKSSITVCLFVIVAKFWWSGYNLLN